MKRSKFFIMVTTVLFICLMVIGTGQLYAGEKGPFTIGVSNGQITNTWRTQMVSDLNQEFLYYKGKGVAKSLKIQHAGSDVNLQISQIRNLVNSGVDLLLINPLSSTALNPVIEEATARNIRVIIFDQMINNDEVLQVVPDQAVFMQNLANYVIDKLGGKGGVVYMSGYDGQPANTLRDNVVYELVKKYPEMHILTKVNGNWDPTTAQQAMTDVLAAFPQIDGVISQDGMQLGIIKAFENANRQLVPISGDSTIAFLEKWIALKKSSNFETVAYINGPGFTANLALGIGIRLLQGKELKKELMTGPNKTIMLIKLEPITNENVEKVYEDHITNRGIADFIDGWYSQERIDSLFKQ
jgi:ribose transport system substrate-binding protein